ncbi:MAG: molecular chaperone HtpG [Leptospirales bacterium]
MSKTTDKVEEHSFQAEMEQLLHLIIHSLYTHKEIFLRELVSNASDALHKIRYLGLTDKGFLDESAELRIDITLDEEKKQVTIKDTGIGMTHDEIIANIGTIAKSGTMKFLKELSEKKDDKQKSDLIGQFGVGFYSVFMVAQEVTINTRSFAKDEKAWQWKSEGTGKFTLEEIEKADRGTEIIIQLKEGEDEFASADSLKNIINKYSNFVDFPINIGEEHANKSSALWRKQASQVKEEERTEFYKFISHDMEDQLGHVHLNAEAPIAYSALLFFPAKSNNDIFQKPEDFHVHLYVKKVFIQNDCKDLLPSYLRFMRGVVDSEDLDLNVSREVTQHSPLLAKIRKALTGRILKEIEKWAEKDAKKFETFYTQFGNVIKEGIEVDYENRDRLVDLLRFQSTKTKQGETVSLAQYLERMKADQKEIYYLSGRNLDVLKNSPNLEYFTEKDIEVLLLDHVIDDYLMPVIAKYKEKDITSIDKAEVDSGVKDKDELDPVIVTSFIGRMKAVIGDEIEDIKESKRLLKSPCSLVSSKEAMNQQMEMMMKAMNPDFAGAKRILEVNLQHSLMKKIAGLYQKSPDSPEFTTSVKALYDSAKLLDDRLEDPSVLVSRLYDYMDSALPEPDKTSAPKVAEKEAKPAEKTEPKAAKEAPKKDSKDDAGKNKKK